MDVYFYLLSHRDTLIVDCWLCALEGQEGKSYESLCEIEMEKVKNSRDKSFYWSFSGDQCDQIGRFIGLLASF